MNVLDPVLIPFILMVAAYIIGRVSLRSEDSTASTRNRASRIYLYLDGAFGLYPQLITSTALALALVPQDITKATRWQWFGWPIFWFAAAWQLVISLKFIPEDLFNNLGYRSFGLADARPAPPTVRYKVAVLLVIPLVAWICRAVVAVIAVLFANLIR
jgi:hypothetical protein